MANYIKNQDESAEKRSIKGLGLGLQTGAHKRSLEKRSTEKRSFGMEEGPQNRVVYDLPDSNLDWLPSKRDSSKSNSHRIQKRSLMDENTGKYMEMPVRIRKRILEPPILLKRVTPLWAHSSPSLFETPNSNRQESKRANLAANPADISSFGFDNGFRYLKRAVHSSPLYVRTRKSQGMTPAIARDYYETMYGGGMPMKRVVQMMPSSMVKRYIPQNIQANIQDLPPQMQKFLMQFNSELENQASGRSRNGPLVKSGAIKSFKRSNSLIPNAMGARVTVMKPQQIRMVQRVPERVGKGDMIEVVPDTQNKRVVLLDNGSELFNPM